MATITEDYVSYETAKLLKEKGFDEPCHCFYEYRKRLYNDMDKYFPDGMKNSDHDKEGNKGISAPTHQMAMKWLREIHNIAINIGWGEIFEDKFQWWCIILNYKDGSILRDSEYYATYEEAVEKAIKYTLEKLI